MLRRDGGGTVEPSPGAPKQLFGATGAAPFGGLGGSGAAAPATGGGLFGGTPASAAFGSMFAGAAAGAPAAGLFGAPPASSGGAGLFGGLGGIGGSGAAAPATGGGLFGSPASAAAVTGLFAAPSPSAAAIAAGLFGAPPASSGGAGLFGGLGGIGGSGAAAPATGGELFGTPAAARPFGSLTTAVATSAAPYSSGAPVGVPFAFGAPSAQSSAPIGINNQFQPSAGPSVVATFSSASGVGGFGVASPQQTAASSPFTLGTPANAGVGNLFASSSAPAAASSAAATPPPFQFGVTVPTAPLGAPVGDGRLPSGCTAFGAKAAGPTAPLGQGAASVVQTAPAFSDAAQAASSGFSQATLEKKLVALKAVDEAIESLKRPHKPGEYRPALQTEQLNQRLVISRDVLILEVARLRLQEAVAVHERSNPSNPELPVLRQSLKELIDRLNTLPAQLSSGL